ncbi:MAG TPA: hypothetical protein ENH32_01275 [Proteobacteria bacterium]|nr:hypothetical protein BMS3Abin14_00583 [bacterium BMS3Abin14]HDL52585.1 hypothetical protein [Pseudomonadota bacterium]
MSGRLYVRCVTALLPLVLVFSLTMAVSAEGNDLRSVLQNAYGESVSSKAAALGFLDLTGEEAGYLKETVEMFAGAGFSARLCLDYLDLASGLVGAGISLKDIEAKVREGIAKNAGGSRVVAVITDRTQWLKKARALTLSLENDGVSFLDKQMSYRVFADYLARGVSGEDLGTHVMLRELDDYPALENLVR